MIKRTIIFRIGALSLLVGLAIFFVLPKNKAAKGGKEYGGTLRFAIGSKLYTLNPLTSNSLDQQRLDALLFDPLLIASANKNGWRPFLAKRVQVTSGGKKLIIQLKDHIYFHSDPCFRFHSRQLSAEDLEYTLSEALSKKPNNQLEPLLHGLIKSMHIRDRFTLELVLNDAYTHIFHILTHPGLGIRSKRAAQYYGNNIDWHPVGTGAFCLDHASANEFVFQKNEDYWRHDNHGNRLPFLNQISVIRQVPPSKEHVLFSQNQIDLLFDLPLNQLNQAFGSLNDAQKGKNELHDVYSKPSSKIHYLGFNTQRFPFTNELVRKAFLYAIDVDYLCNVVLKGEGRPVKNHFIPEQSGYVNPLLKKQEGWVYQPSFARQLLLESTIKLKQIPLYVGASPNSTPALWCQELAKMLQKNLGIRVRLIYGSAESKNKAIKSGKALFWRAGWVGDYPGPESYLKIYTSKTDCPSARYKHFYNACVVAKTNTQQQQFANRCEQELILHTYLIPIYTEDFFVIYKLRARNFTMNRSGVVDFANVYLKEL
ncbi:MAG: hypothetical protein RLZZ301_182 [Bacteroidota bacterium]|jgi:ABC-type transport system substrate-binding protein